MIDGYDEEAKVLTESEEGLYINDDLVEDYNDGYYHVFQDAYKYPDATVIVSYSRRGPGKTTGALLGAYLRGKRIMYIKRTIADVKMITKGGSVDLSPWATINRIAGTNFKAIPVKGVDGFAEVVSVDENDTPLPNEEPIGYICALSAAGKIKGFDLSDKVDIMIVDEFVPNKGVIARQSEGDQTLDILATLMRDRHKRGLPNIKLWLFSNCDYLACPISRTLGLLDDIYELSSKKASYFFNSQRGMLIHHITSEEFTSTINDEMFSFMKDTDWYKRNIEGELDEDFSNIEIKSNTKNYKCIAKLWYNNKNAYILFRESDSSYYITYDYNIRVSNGVQYFNLTLENDIRLFNITPLYQDILKSLMINKVKYSCYSLYDLIKRYYDIFTDKLY